MDGANVLRNEQYKRAGQLTTPEEERMLKTRFKLLQYDDYGDTSDSGGGSVATGIAAAAASLGSAYLVSQNQNLSTQSPVVIRPPAAYGSLSSPGSSSILILFVVGIVVVVGFLAFGKS